MPKIAFHQLSCLQYNQPRGVPILFLSRTGERVSIFNYTTPDCCRKLDLAQPRITYCSSLQILSVPYHQANRMISNRRTVKLNYIEP